MDVIFIFLLGKLILFWKTEYTLLEKLYNVLVNIVELLYEFLIPV